MNEEVFRKEKLSVTGLRVVIAAVVVVGLVFLGDALDDSANSVSSPVWPVVRAADGSCVLAAQPFPRASVVRFSALCDLDKRPLGLDLKLAKPRAANAKDGEVKVVEQVVLSRTGEVVGQVFRGSRALGRCRVLQTVDTLIRCQPTGGEPFPQRVQARISLKVTPSECGPMWVLSASFGAEEFVRGLVLPVLWRGCGALPPVPTG